MKAYIELVDVFILLATVGAIFLAVAGLVAVSVACYFLAFRIIPAIYRRLVGSSAAVVQENEEDQKDK